MATLPLLFLYQFIFTNTASIIFQGMQCKCWYFVMVPPLLKSVATTLKNKISGFKLSYDVNERRSSLLPAERNLLHIMDSMKAPKSDRIANSAFSPQPLQALLPFISKIQVAYTSEGKTKDFISKVSGSKITIMYGELTGSSLSNMNDNTFTRRSRRLLDATVEAQKPVLATSREHSTSLPLSGIRCLAVPLFDTSLTTVTHIVLLITPGSIQMHSP
ncbi:hypothetical protein [Kordiimonas sediminis]|uniref:hypothetical protein n=1 Tax=Kordiimonas sediminis TaxID=1735581 RepID=UPI00174845D2|nr:hypothetical protein [Kordiimonas sediminis]